MMLHNKIFNSHGHHEQKCVEDVFEDFKYLTSPFDLSYWLITSDLSIITLIKHYSKGVSMC